MQVVAKLSVQSINPIYIWFQFPKLIGWMLVLEAIYFVSRFWFCFGYNGDYVFSSLVRVNLLSDVLKIFLI